MNVIEILRDLVKFNTIKDKENQAIINYIEKYLIKLGFKTEAKDKYLVMSIGEKQKVGFLGHTDTVEYIEGWNQDPFKLTIEDDKIYGLGTCDMKGGIACFLEAVSEIDFSKLKYGVKCFFTYDEEIGLKGVQELIKLGDMPEYMIIGEPTNNIVMIGSKGLLAIKIKTNGKKVHSSTPNKGVSANSNMIKLLFELEKFYSKEVRPEEIEKYDVPFTTMNIGLINGGSAINSVAAECNSYIDFRIAQNNHIEVIKEKIKELCQKYDASYKIDFEIKAFYNDIEFIKEKNTAGFITEASFIKAKRMILGPGPVTAHEVNEYVTKESVEKAVQQYKKMIIQCCQED